MRILVLNLTRFGDQLQTSPVIAGLKERYPDAAITVCVDRNFAAVCHCIPGIDRVWEIDLDRVGHLLLGGTGAELRAAYAAVDETVTALRAARFDMALNYSSSRMSAVLMGMITGIGGGMLRDVLAGRVPVIFEGTLYATPAMLGATTAVLLHGPGAPLWLLVLLGAGGCLVLRLLAMLLGWRAPLPRGPASL